MTQMNAEPMNPVPASSDAVTLKVTGLRTHFRIGSTIAKAVDDVDLTVRQGKTLAVVGESGSGKSVTSLSIMRLLAPSARIIDGTMTFKRRDGSVVDLARANNRVMRKIRGGEIAMIFQEPMTSLNPLYTVGDQIIEMIRLHETISRADARSRARRMLELVEIASPEQRLDDYPHSMSGGMRQRVMIALALACDPFLLIADEPTTALDVTIQAQILELLRRLQHEMGMSILFVTHNLGVVAEIADDVAVMYAGKVVEQAPVRSLFKMPRHPYTKGLIACIPDPARDQDETGRRRPLSPIPGSVPSVTNLPRGCAYADRCPLTVDKCRVESPPLIAVETLHSTRCWRHEDV
ncbi:ABC transporter ATP-binding protein [Aurantimonas coralicida]|uniref:ABC transporter ATP-binding protein n=1 Tax=Aurantimonas coralicida TaxID=182270 RepID=UPI001E62DC88|nr:ABC transporter ATP-binding protein [Aurantimonas coralicida]MCD1645610.1 ABC transporter ATP-binding protein [Aurantimonas coralicida]|tara:strand:- start:3941 stop:4990 length:1050 start_codon:yes stop_codon:yes gene_type:complete